MNRNSIDVYCNNATNMGDVLIKDIMSTLFGYLDVKYTKSSKRIDLYAIGSSLGMFEYKERLFNQTYQFLQGMLLRKLNVWGGGFMVYGEDLPFYRRNINFTALRGELTKKRVEKIINSELLIPTGDPGLLASLLLKENPMKKYDIGIIAHFKEQDEPYFRYMTEYYHNSLFIDIKAAPSVVIPQVASCKCIISSSLHGLIVSDSLGIPNTHIVVTNKMKGDGYKFDDYYSAFNISHRFIDTKNPLPSIDWIKSNYQIEYSMVKLKQKQLVEAFPFKTNVNIN